MVYSHSGVGFPDLVLVQGKRVLFRELKVGKNKPNANQRHWGALLMRAGQDYAVWRPDSEWEDQLAWRR